MPSNPLTDFVNAVQGRETIVATNRARGLSNGARFVEGALLVGVMNNEKFDRNSTSFAAFSSAVLSPDVEVFFGVVVRTDIKNLVARLDKMLARAKAEVKAGVEDRKYSDRNNNVSFFLRPGRQLSLRNKTGGKEESETDLEPAVLVDRVYYAVLNRAGAKNSLVASSFVGELGKLVGAERVDAVSLWSSDELSPQMKRMPASLKADTIAATVNSYGGAYSPELVTALHNAMSFHPRKHFVILTGLSGSGKTSLAIRYSAAVHGLTELGRDPLTFVSPVRPDWTDPSGLTGYRDVFTKRYVVPPFLQAIFRANENQASPVFVILDEMNLARVEYYLAEILSAMESGWPIHLHSEANAIPSDFGYEVPGDVPWPSNLFIIGTINIDETTHQISPKVLDRAIVIDTTNIDLPTFFDRIGSESRQLAESVRHCQPILTALHEKLHAYGLGFGYRTADEIVRYMAFATPDGESQEVQNTLDILFLQKIMPRLRGTERHRKMLDDVLKLVDGMPLSKARVGQMVDDLDEGSFEALR